MSEKCCKICNREFKYAWMVKRHMERINPCKPAETTKKSNNIAKIEPSIADIVPIQNILEFKCIYCDKIFKHKSSLYRHKNQFRCKEKSQNDQIILKSNLSDKKINVNNVTNNFNSNINNIQNNINININPFGKEETCKLKEKDILRILNKAYMAIPDAIKSIHYNIPENRNLYQPNKNKPYITYFDGTDWAYKKIETVSSTLSSKISTLLEEWFEEYNEKIKQSKKERIQSMIDDYNDGKLEDRFQTEFKLFLLNYSNKIKSFVAEEIDKITNL